MNKLTRQEVEGVIERIAINQNEHLCPDGECHTQCIFGEKEVYIGDVLEKINEKDKPDRDVMWLALSHLWQPLGLSKSLQEIVSESGYEIYTDLVYAELQLLRSPKANALFSFLIEIFPPK